jgi:predicted NAD/FAD-dependent oxidoreductase
VVQRWALARALEPLGGGVLYDPASGIGLGGDWACGGRVEGVFSSGQALAARLLELDAEPGISGLMACS